MRSKYKVRGLVYLSTVPSGKDYLRRFNAAVDYLNLRAYKVVNALKHECPVHQSWADDVAEDIVLMLQCHSAFFFHDWEKSSQARLEHALATRLNIEIIYENTKDNAKD